MLLILRYFKKVAKEESAISAAQDLGLDGKGTFGRLRAWLNSSRSRSSDSALERVSMDSENYYWWLIRLGHSDYAVQYTGPDPAVHFPLSLAGTLCRHLIAETQIMTFWKL